MPAHVPATPDPPSAAPEVGSAAPASPTAAAAGRRERRKAETRARLLGAARALFVERGYHATRPQDIARAADLAAGTFYVHVADKRDAFLAFTAETAAELMERIRAELRAAEAPDGTSPAEAPDGASAADAAGAASPVEARLGAALRALLAWSDANPGVLRVCFADEAVIATPPTDGRGGASLRDRLATTLAEGLRAGMRRGQVPDDYDPRVVAYGIVGFVQHALTFGAREPVDRHALLANVTRFCGRALRASVAPPARTGAPEEPPTCAPEEDRR